MTLAIFDLDNTLIAGDSDHLWGEFLIDQGIVDADGFKVANDGFFQDYQDGRLDIFAYQEFVLGVLKGRPLEELDRLRQRTPTATPSESMASESLEFFDEAAFEGVMGLGHKAFAETGGAAPEGRRGQTDRPKAAG